ncbi:hypothetical protein [Solimicrobium silvestre]|uniref:Lipoprotein n=1 Tax=Solimicrobium silvestre TaxID=2099400 RepID=A0A2S9GVG0_9BURK|nr:hypothetical protein [Solimicrobium silvestre]PRC91712.1 hypothetical protein S2091_3650 [Solimicrobium silvestre]
MHKNSRKNCHIIALLKLSLLIASASCLLNGCVVIAVADAVVGTTVSVGAAVVGTTVNVGSAVVGSTVDVARAGVRAATSAPDPVVPK